MDCQRHVFCRLKLEHHCSCVSQKPDWVCTVGYRVLSGHAAQLCPDFLTTLAVDEGVGILHVGFYHLLVLDMRRDLLFPDFFVCCIRGFSRGSGLGWSNHGHPFYGSLRVIAHLVGAPNALRYLLRGLGVRVCRVLWARKVVHTWVSSAMTL